VLLCASNVDSMDCLKSENITRAVKIVDLKKIVLIKKYRGWRCLS
jgi:hypothetical protein